MKEMVGGCCVCSDERGWPDNPLVYCDGNGCTVAVHQACYGIVTVPTGPWYCRKCESPETKGKVRCELCPSRSGALKQTDNGGWAHVVCALYIPEVRFASVTSMEPIVLGLVPPERYNKICYICEEEGKTHRAAAGACMQCNKSGCKQQFHVTCAQSRGLLCEEAGNYLDNVKYCGYCSHHYSKLFVNFEATSVVKKKGGNVKTIPPYKPLAQDSHSSDSSGEKDGEGDAPASSAASGSATPTQAGKTKGPGRKSHGNASAKNAANASGNKNPPPPQPMDKKKSPARRGSSTGEASGSKNNTPAPSPQHSTEPPMAAKASTTPVASAKSSPNDPAPVVKAESVGVISSVSSATATAAPSTTSTSAPISTSVVQTNKTSFQESVITNTDAMDTKQTKKRKAVAAAQAAAAAAAAAASAAADLTNSPKNNDSSSSAQTWDQRDDNQEPVEKVIRRTVSEHDPTPGHFSSMTPPAPLLPPPPAHSPSTSANRHMQSPLAGPSGMNPPPSAIRSPSQHPQGRERDGQASLLVSVPLPSTSYGINLSTHQQAQVAQASDVYKTSPSPLNPPTSNASPHIQYYQQHSQQKHVSLEQGHGLPGQSMHGHPPRNSWGGLNVQYEQQHAPQDKPGSSGMPGPSKDGGMGGPAVPATMRNKKRAAMSMANQAPPPNQLPPPSGPILATTIRTKKRAAMSTLTSMEPPPPPPPPAQMASTSTQNLASVRRGPQPTPPPLYTETVPDSPPCSPGERALKNAIKGAHTAPQMLGNELNPESMVADRLQEQLTAELAAHEAGIMKNDPLVQPPLINKASGGRSSSAQSLDQLLERQWEQGSQFLMEQAQHFDIASLLSCLHQLRTENVRLEDHVANLLQRRDHLLAVNARLAIPLAAGYVSAAPVPPPPEPPRCPRENGGQIRPPPPRSDVVTSAHQPMPDQRAHQSHQRHHREERPDERQGMRVPDVVHIAHQRPLNIDAQLTMREVQQKPS